MASSTQFVLPHGVHKLIPESERVQPIWLDVGPEFDVLLSDAIQPLQMTLQWFLAQYGMKA